MKNFHLERFSLTAVFVCSIFFLLIRTVFMTEKHSLPGKRPTRMLRNQQAILDHIIQSGATHCQFIPAQLLMPEERIRSYCYQNICENYHKHLTCPPHTGTIAEITGKLKPFRTGILIQYSEHIDVRNDPEGLKRTKLNLHRIVLETERYLKEEMKCEHIWGMIGGRCDLCDECAGFSGNPCVHPDTARVSMEAVAIDVVSLLKRLHLDAEFHDDMITWTGIVLTDEEIR